MSTIIASNISDGTTSVPSTYVVNGSAKVWLNMNGTGTPTARDSFNISSITDSGTGVYQGNFSANMNNNSYSATTGVSESGVGGVARIVMGDGNQVNYTLILPVNTSTAIDYQFITVTIHGDLA